MCADYLCCWYNSSVSWLVWLINMVSLTISSLLDWESSEVLDFNEAFFLVRFLNWKKVLIVQNFFHWHDFPLYCLDSYIFLLVCILVNILLVWCAFHCCQELCYYLNSLIHFLFFQLLFYYLKVWVTNESLYVDFSCFIKMFLKILFSYGMLFLWIDYNFSVFKHVLYSVLPVN